MSRSVPTISVLMPVYNSERYLKQAIESILSQTFTDFEFLIIDDGSRDGSAALLQTYAAQDPRIKLTIRHNCGIAKTLNEMLFQAKGELIARMDADDIALPDRFQQQVEFLHQHPEIVCVGSAQEWIDSEGNFLREWSPPADDDTIQSLILTGKSQICHPSAMMRRQAVLQVNGYNESMITASDLDLWLKLGEIGQLANLPDRLLKYRFHDSAISEKRLKEQHHNARSACQRAWERRNIQGHYEATSSWRHETIIWCGWRMFNQGKRRSAITYGLRAIKAIPSNWEGWKLLACALVKRLPEPEV